MHPNVRSSTTDSRQDTKSLDVHQQRDGRGRRGTYTECNTTQPQKEWNMPCSVTWMDPATITLSKVSQIETKISYDIIYMLNLKDMIQMNLFKKQKWTLRHGKQTRVTKEGRQER